MKPLRRLILILLNPRPPIWASSSLWGWGGFASLVIMSLAAPLPASGDWQLLTLRIVAAVVMLMGILAAYLRRPQIVFYQQQLLRRGAGLCPGCGYNLQGTPTVTCPECGLDVDAAAREAARVLGLDRPDQLR